MRRNQHFARLLLCASWGLSACAGSQGKKQPEGPPIDVLTEERRIAPRPELSTQSDTPGQDLVSLSKIPPGAVGPRLGITSRGHVLIWADVAGADPALHSQFVAPGRAASPPRRLVEMSRSARLLQLGRNREGELVASTVRRVGERDMLEALVLGEQGQLRGGPYLLVDTPAQIIFTQTVPTASGALCLWVERTNEGAALYAAVLKPKGAERPVRVVENISAWQIVHSKAGLNVVTREGRQHVNIVLRQLGASAQVLGAPVVVARDVAGGLDLDLAVSKDRILVAYTDTSGEEGRVVGAYFDHGANPIGTLGPLTAPRGHQALVRVLGNVHEERMLVFWEEPLFVQHGLPSVFGASLEPGKGSAQPSVHFPVVGDDPLLPLFEAGEKGVAVVTADPLCPSDVDACTVPELEREAALIGYDGRIQLSRRYRLASSEAPSMAWDLSCGEGQCTFLVAGNGTPVDVFLAPLKKSLNRGTAFSQLEDFPRLAQSEVIAEIPELSALDFQPQAGVSARESLGWVSYFDPEAPYVIPSEPAPDGRRAPVRARLESLSVQTSAQKLEVEQTVVSYRARSLGKIGLVAPSEDKPGLLAWAAVDGKHPQLFATVIDRLGKKVTQRMLTRTPGEISDVAAIRAGDGFVIAWVDGRNDAPEVYAARVDERLNMMGKPVQITEGARAPAGIALGVAFEEVWIAWSDARGASGSGAADIFGARLRAEDATVVGSERRWFETPGHSHEVRLVPAMSGNASSGVVVEWIDSDPAELGRGGKVLTALIDRQGRILEEPQDLPIPRGATDLAVDCDEKECRSVVVVAASADRSPSQLWTVVRSYRGKTSSELLQPLGARGSDGILPQLAGDVLYYADRAGTKWLLRRAQITWQ